MDYKPEDKDLKATHEDASNETALGDKQNNQTQKNEETDNNSKPKDCNDSNSKCENLNTNKDSKKQILGFMSIGLPGMGKTTYIKQLKKLLQERGYTITIISSDFVRKELMDEIRKNNPSLSHHEAFEESTKNVHKRYYEYIEQAILKTRTLTEKLHVIFLDKNHPPNIIQDAIDFFHQPKFKQEFDIQMVVIKPTCGETFSTKNHSYPFSLNFLVKCLQRALGREGHETLIGGEKKIATVELGFFHKYKDFIATESTFNTMGADLTVEVPFTYEDAIIEKELKEVLSESLEEVLDGLEGFNVDQDKLGVFLEKVSKFQGMLKDVEVEIVNKKTQENLDRCLEIFGKET